MRFDALEKTIRLADGGAIFVLRVWQSAANFSLAFESVVGTNADRGKVQGNGSSKRHPNLYSVCGSIPTVEGKKGSVVSAEGMVDGYCFHFAYRDFKTREGAETTYQVCLFLLEWEGGGGDRRRHALRPCGFRQGELVKCQKRQWK